MTSLLPSLSGSCPTSSMRRFTPDCRDSRVSFFPVGDSPGFVSSLCSAGQRGGWRVQRKYPVFTRLRSGWAHPFARDGPSSWRRALGTDASLHGWRLQGNDGTRGSRRTDACAIGGGAWRVTTGRAGPEPRMDNDEDLRNVLRKLSTTARDVMRHGCSEDESSALSRA